MDSTPTRERFDEAYTSGSAPWVIDEPQPAVVALERDGWIRGSVLDVGCGTGEHTIHLADRGYDVVGVDVSPAGIEQARAGATARGVSARFEVGDAYDLGGEPRYDTVLDSALFHIFDDDDRARYVRSLARVVRPGGVVHVLALSDTGPGFGPQVSETTILGAFLDGWRLELLQMSTYRGAVVRPEHAALLGREIGEHVDLPAWLARVRVRRGGPGTRLTSAPAR
jgi:SAM-dependent methyltransferase